MRKFLLTLCTLAGIASCAAKPKAVARAATLPAAPPALRLKADGPAVAYAVPAGWRATPSREGEPVILVRPGDRDEAIALVLQETAFEDTIENVTVRWAMLAATLLKDFHATSLEDPAYTSDEASRVVIHGVDGTQRPLVLECRIRHLGANTADFWAIVLLAGSAAQATELTTIGDNLVKSLQMQVQTTPK